MAEQAAPGTGFSFTKICVDDLERAASFYAGVFGMKEWSRHESPTIQEIMLKSSDAPAAPTLVLMKPIPAPAIVIGTGHGPIGMIVADIDDVVARTLKAGGKITKEPYGMAQLGIKVAFVEDLDGHAVELVEMVSR